MNIYIDADACQKAAKELVYKAASKAEIKVFVVANAYQNTPVFSWIEFILVEQGPDVADQWIADRATTGDLVITSDIPLAAAVVKSGALVITSYGKTYDSQNVGDALASRDLMQKLREGGAVLKGGPAPYSPKDKEQFANALNKWIQNTKK